MEDDDERNTDLIMNLGELIQIQTFIQTSIELSENKGFK